MPFSLSGCVPFCAGSSALCKIAVEHNKQDELLCISVKHHDSSNFWLGCLLRGLTSIFVGVGGWTMLHSSGIVQAKQRFNEFPLNEPRSASPVIKSDDFNLSRLRRRAIRRKSCARLTAPRPSWPPAAMMAKSSCGTWFLGGCSAASSALLQLSSDTPTVISDLER